MVTSETVAITGLGLVTPIGVGPRGADNDVWSGLLAGKSGFAPIESFDTSRYNVSVGAEVRGFDPAGSLRRLDPARVGRASQLAIAGAWLALEDAGVDLQALDPHRAAVAMGTTSGEPREVERLNDLHLANALDRLGAEFVERYPCHRIAAQVAQEIGFAGPTMMLPTACAAGNYAIAHACDLLLAGRADLALAGGADAFSRITYTGFAKLGAIAPDLCRPFDKGRQGMIPGEGAGILVLERVSDARRRGARIYAEVAGYGLSCDAHHMTAAHPEGVGPARAMERALRASGLTPDDVDYVSAHGTGTPTNDKLETLAVKRVFGGVGGRPKVPVTSIKSMLGHTMGAASAIEAAVCALAIVHGAIPPTMNFREVDPDCDLDCVPNVPRATRVDVAMNNAYAFGGNNASVILRRAS